MSIDQANIERRARLKDANDRYRLKIGVKAVPRTITCKRCGEEGTVRTRRHKYCDKCSAAFAMLGSSIHYHLRQNRPVLQFGVEICCKICGKAFSRRAAAHCFCSTACKHAHRSTVTSRPGYRLNNRMRAGIWASIRGKKAGRSWQSLVGYTTEDLMRHLERQFHDGMSWANIGRWEIDHRVPLAAFSFGLPTDAAFKTAWSLDNLQPLWAADNNRKRAKIIGLV